MTCSVSYPLVFMLFTQNKWWWNGVFVYLMMTMMMISGCNVMFCDCVFMLLCSATTTRREVFVWKFNPYGCISALMFDASIYSVTYSEYTKYLCVRVYVHLKYNFVQCSTHLSEWFICIIISYRIMYLICSTTVPNCLSIAAAAAVSTVQSNCSRTSTENACSLHFAKLLIYIVLYIKKLQAIYSMLYKRQI